MGSNASSASYNKQSQQKFLPPPNTPPAHFGLPPCIIAPLVMGSAASVHLSANKNNNNEQGEEDGELATGPDGAPSTSSSFAFSLPPILMRLHALLRSCDDCEIVLGPASTATSGVLRRRNMCLGGDSEVYVRCDECLASVASVESPLAWRSRAPTRLAPRLIPSSLGGARSMDWILERMCFCGTLDTNVRRELAKTIAKTVQKEDSSSSLAFGLVVPLSGEQLLDQLVARMGKERGVGFESAFVGVLPTEDSMPYLRFLTEAKICVDSYDRQHDNPTGSQLLSALASATCASSVVSIALIGEFTTSDFDILAQGFPNLRHLALCLHSAFSTKVVLPMALRKDSLESCKLSYFFQDEEGSERKAAQLERFLMRHRRSLKRLSFEGIVLEDGGAALKRAFKNVNLCALREFCLWEEEEGLHYDVASTLLPAIRSSFALAAQLTVLVLHFDFNDCLQEVGPFVLAMTNLQRLHLAYSFPLTVAFADALSISCGKTLRTLELRSAVVTDNTETPQIATILCSVRKFPLLASLDISHLSDNIGGMLGVRIHEEEVFISTFLALPEEERIKAVWLSFAGHQVSDDVKAMMESEIGKQEGVVIHWNVYHSNVPPFGYW